jgi:hypothetical protein
MYNARMGRFHHTDLGDDGVLSGNISEPLKREGKTIPSFGLAPAGT